jgi:serine/threonine-protein kinase RIO1
LEDIDYAVKIFKRVLAGFSNRLDYMEGDERYSHKKHLRLKQREIIIIWAEKEWRNLKRMYSKGVRCPHPIALKDNVILMEFIGHKATPAPKLKDALPRFKSEERVMAVFAMVIDIIRDMYQLCHLVHGDLSEYNLLYFDSLVYVIDVGQAVQSHHPNADEYLRRDIKAVCSFFSLNGVTIPTTEADIFAMVKDGATDADITDVDDVDLEAEVANEA